MDDVGIDEHAFAFGQNKGLPGNFKLDVSFHHHHKLQFFMPMVLDDGDGILAEVGNINIDGMGAGITGRSLFQIAIEIDVTGIGNMLKRLYESHLFLIWIFTLSRIFYHTKKDFTIAFSIFVRVAKKRIPKMGKNYG